MPNTFAYAMLLIWPMVTIMLFQRQPPDRALIWSLLAGYLFLPPATGYDLPLLPTLSKDNIPSLTALFICIFMLQKRVSFLPRSHLGKALFLMLLASPVLTNLTNREPIFLIDRVIPSLTMRDALSGMMGQVLLLLPFVLGRALLADPKSHEALLKAVLFSALAYSFLILIEVRLSPQLNIWIYGFFPHIFSQQFRFGGFRPVVFLSHGLWVAFFVMMAVLAAGILWRTVQDNSRKLYSFGMIYMFFILILCKSVGSIIYSILLLPVIFTKKRRLQIVLPVIVVSILVSYPALRNAEVIPEDDLVAWAGNYSAERAESLNFRFFNEGLLLEHANHKPWFGWGGWGRNKVYDPQSGRDITTTDGYWIIVFGYAGWFGYVATFGLYGLPLLLLWRQSKRMDLEAIPLQTTGLAVILAINLFDFLPNATATPLTWLMCGALIGYVEALQAGKLGAGTAPAEPDARYPDRGRPQPTFTRQAQPRREDRQRQDAPPRFSRY